MFCHKEDDKRWWANQFFIFEYNVKLYLQILKLFQLSPLTNTNISKVFRGEIETFNSSPFFSSRNLISLFFISKLYILVSDQYTGVHEIQINMIHGSLTASIINDNKKTKLRPQCKLGDWIALVRSWIIGKLFPQLFMNNCWPSN